MASTLSPAIGDALKAVPATSHTPQPMIFVARMKSGKLHLESLFYINV
jgi:hypothetical protein